MRVYGDHWRTVRPRERLAELARTLQEPDAADDRRERLNRALIAAGELAQGIADADLDESGVDHPTAGQTSAMTLCIAIARRLSRRDTDARQELLALAGHPLPAEVRCKLAEGYAFYAVLPDAYASAA